MTRIWLSQPDVGPLEREALVAAFDSGWIAPNGPDLDAFESEVSALTGWPGAVAVASGTAGLHLALGSVGVGRGDIVLASTFTFVASVNAITYCGATPVFVDSETASWNMSPALLDAAARRLHRAGTPAKAVVVVDLYGQCADMDAITAVCREHNLALVEDAAEAVGARYKNRPAGTLGDIGVFSFNGNKILTTSGGGMVLTPELSTATSIRYLATQARQPTVHYEHTDIGFNYRMSNLLAAVGRAQLQRLPQMMKRRHEINARYRRALAPETGITFMPVPEWSSWNGWLTCVVFDDVDHRQRVMAELAAHDIESRPLWKPMHRQPVYSGCQAELDGTSDDLFARGLCLPSSSALSDDDVDTVISQVLACPR